MYLFGKHINKPVLKYGQRVLYEIWRSVCSGSVMLEERKEDLLIKEDKEKKKKSWREGRTDRTTWRNHQWRFLFIL